MMLDLKSVTRCNRGRKGTDAFFEFMRNVDIGDSSADLADEVVVMVSGEILSQFETSGVISSHQTANNPRILED